jgi:hypothetical protein
MTKAQTYVEKKVNEKISVELQNSLWAEEILTEGLLRQRTIPWLNTQNE